MSNRISFRSWVANLGKGVWQAICSASATSSV